VLLKAIPGDVAGVHDRRKRPCRQVRNCRRAVPNRTRCKCAYLLPAGFEVDMASHCRAIGCNLEQASQEERA
jgi:hypothetical protein